MNGGERSLRPSDAASTIDSERKAFRRLDLASRFIVDILCP